MSKLKRTVGLLLAILMTVSLLGLNVFAAELVYGSGVTAPDVIDGDGDRLVLSDTTTQQTVTLTGNFTSSSGCAINIGSGWIVNVGDAANPVTVSSNTDTAVDVYGIKVSGNSTVNLVNCSVAATNTNQTAGKAYGVYADNRAVVNMGSAPTADAYTSGPSITTYGASGNYGITANNGATLNLYHGSVYSQQQNATAVSVYNGILNAVGGGVVNNQANSVFYAHTDGYLNDTAISVSGTTSTWRIKGVGLLFSGYVGLNVSGTTTGRPLEGGTFVGQPAVFVNGGIDKALATNYYLRNDAQKTTADYAAFSDGSRAVSSTGSAVNGTVTVTNALLELNNAMTAPATASIKNYSMPCNIEMDNGLVISGISHTLDMKGRNLTSKNTSSSDYTISVTSGARLTITDTVNTRYTNLTGTPSGVIRNADSGAAVKVMNGGVLNLGTTDSFGPMISGVGSAGSTVQGIDSQGTVVAYSCGVYGTYAGATAQGVLFDVIAGSLVNQERAVFCGGSYGLRQMNKGILRIGGGIFTTDSNTKVTSAAAASPWGLYIEYGSKTADASATTDLKGGFFSSVSTVNSYIKGRNLTLADLMASGMSFVDNMGVNASSGIITRPATYKVASPTIMEGRSSTINNTGNPSWNNYNFYGYAIYDGMDAAFSEEYNNSTGLHVPALANATMTSYFTVGDGSVYDTTTSPNGKTCTCCGAEYTGKTCPNCTTARCSVCGKCPNHCTCKNTDLITDDHFAYIKGYPDGTFKPTGNITRAEAATIFYSLLQNKNYTTSAYFTDVNHRDWYYTQVSCLASKGIIQGYPDGTFKPNGKVTKAEFMTMASKFFSLRQGTMHFSDVPSTFWAYKYISSAVAHGWISDSYGQFYPNKPITRQEVILIVNNMTGRVPDEYFIDNNISSLNTFRDVYRSNANYYEIIEAANGHTFMQSGGVETWKGLE